MRILVCLLAALGIACPGVAQETAPPGPKRPRLVITDFVKLTGDQRFDALSRSIPEILQVIFFGYDVVRVVPRGELWGIYKGPADQQAPLRLFGPEMLKSVDANFLVRGDFIELGGVFQVHAELTDLKTNQPVKVDAVSMTNKNLFPGLESLAANILEALSRAKAVAYKPRRFAVSCFVDNSSSPGSGVGRALRRNLPMLLPQHVTGEPGRLILPWADVKANCDSAPTAASLTSALKLDAVISGSFDVNGSRILVYPEIFIADYGLPLEMSPVEGKSDDYLTLIAEVGKRIKEFTDNSMNDDGGWKVAELVGTKLDAATYANRGEELFKSGDLPLATLFLQKSITTQPLPEAYYYLGLVRLRQQRFEDAAKELNNSLGLRRDATVLKTLGDAFAGARRYQDAIAAYEGATQENPGLLEAHVRIGDVYLFQGKYELARDTYEKMIKADPNAAKNASIYYRLAVASMMQSDDTKAITWYERALQVSPDYVPAKTGLADLLNEKGMQAFRERKYRQAVDLFARGILVRATPEGYYWRARSETQRAVGEASRDYSSAIADYLKVRQLDGDAVDSGLRKSASLNLAEVYLLARKPADAVPLAQHLIGELEKSPGDRMIARFLLVIGRILAGQDYTGELTQLRADLVAPTADPSWSFTMLDDSVKHDPAIDPATRGLVLQISKEVQGAPKAPGKK